ncbi:RagB/SusD family nutrient uptake outer membrane protein [Fulvivirgaceae bacterium BMA10]|uniref:RagB/SusD family nutrient uptake outer membrane protein n=1 Tax=Splendidivirga corallicola TaxID=3051826 RepID=A0ABT8KVE0_9BACT|nr:RagB/SusD family nutrient uptake outer membrane protein [Fulvivirgaceae bacterium BMA10]
MKKTTLIIVFILSTTVACNDDLFDLTPQDSLSGDLIFADEGLIEAFVNRTYGDGIRHGFRRDANLDALSDNAYYTHNNGTWNFLEGGVTPDNGEGTTGNLWASSFSTLRRINLYFDNIETAPVTDAVKEQFNAEMKFIRAWVYYDLLRWYGGVPIVDEVFAVNDDPSLLVRSTYEEVVSRIVNDLDDVVGTLEMRDNSGRASGIAALALKSRVLLYAASSLNNPSNDQAKWTAARDAAKAVIDVIGDNTLHGDYSEVFLGTTTETIWERNFAGGGNNIPLQNHRVNTTNNPNGHAGWGGNTPLQSLVDAYDMANGLPITDPASGYNDQDPYVNRDPRFYATINYNGAMWKGRQIETFNGGLDTSEGPVQPWNGGRTGYYMKKWLNEAEPVNESVPSTFPWIFFRNAEVYLNYAETFLALGDEVNARIWMNKTRTRAGMPDITETGSALVDRYRNERRVELAYENHRFFDILRWQIAEDVLSGPSMGITIVNNNGALSYDYSREVLATRSFDASKHYRFPIPRSEINKSSGLTQNPGYN